MPNPFVHVELSSTDLPRSKAFYAELFSWKLQDMPMPTGDHTYTMVDVGQGTGGGMMPQMMPDAPSAWMSYVLVEDIDATAAKAKKLGATICKDVTDVGMGRLCIFADPSGAILGLWEPSRKPAKKAAKKPAKKVAKKTAAKRARKPATRRRSQR